MPALICSAFVTSSSIGSSRADEPSARLMLSGFRAAAITVAPESSACLTISSPRPRLAPVIIQIRLLAARSKLRHFGEIAPLLSPAISSEWITAYTEVQTTGDDPEINDRLTITGVGVEKVG